MPFHHLRNYQYDWIWSLAKQIGTSPFTSVHPPQQWSGVIKLHHASTHHEPFHHHSHYRRDSIWPPFKYVLFAIPPWKKWLECLNLTTSGMIVSSVGPIRRKRIVCVNAVWLVGEYQAYGPNVSVVPRTRPDLPSHWLSIGTDTSAKRHKFRNITAVFIIFRKQKVEW
jgi:hypothetical protein